MGKFSSAIAALVMGAQLVSPTPVHARGHANAILQRTANDAPAISGVLPGAYIVEFANENETPESFYASLAASGVNVEHGMNLSFRFFNGVSFQLKSSSSSSSEWDFLRQMGAQPQVENI